MPYRDRTNWIDRIAGVHDMPKEMLRALRREQLERLRDVALVVGVAQLGVGCVLLATTVPDPSSPGAVLWSAGLVGLVGWLFFAWHATEGGVRGRKTVFATIFPYITFMGLFWGLTPLAIGGAGLAGEASETVGWNTMVMLSSASGVLIGTALLLTFMPRLAIRLCIAGGTAYAVPVVLLLPFDHAVAMMMLDLAFLTILPLCIVQSARGMVRRQRQGFVVAESHATARDLLDSHEAQGADMLWECDAQFRPLRPSRRLARLVGHDPAGVEAMSCREFMIAAGVRPDDIAAFQVVANRHAAFQDLRCAIEARDGSLAWWSISAHPRHTAEGEFAGYVGFGRDVTQEHRDRSELARMSQTDRLTGLANRDVLHARLNAALGRRTVPLAVLLFDLERFRTINETFGHATGDAIIVQAATRALACLNDRFGNEGDRYCLARLAGDEFALLLEGSGKAAAASMASCIADALAHPFDVEGRTIRAASRIGISLDPSAHANDPDLTPFDHESDAMLRRAELALGALKADGRSGWRFFHVDMDREQRARMEMERELTEHLQVERLGPDCDFELLYQPIVDPVAGRPRVMEALIRWNHPRLGTISPAVFIPMAERLGLIERIGRWSLLTACREAARWGGADGPCVAVNISTPHFAGGNLLQHVRDALETSGLPVDRLEIEVTESVLVGDFGEAERTLDELNALGVHVALDDFGTGYSSLGYLQRFAFDKVKIDRQFVVSGEGDERAQHILAMIVELGVALDMDVVAEGIETHAQARMVSRLGCNLLQGFLFSQPLSAQDAGELVRACGAGTGAVRALEAAA